MVSVPLRNKSSFGVVIGIVRKPTFAVKNIISIETASPLPVEFTLALLAWMQKFYASTMGAVAQLFMPSGFVPTPIQPYNPERPSQEGLLP